MECIGTNKQLKGADILLKKKKKKTPAGVIIVLDQVIFV
jgi:hypothetical protein